MPDTITIRPTAAHDRARIESLLKASYGALLKADYPHAVLVPALPHIARADAALLGSGRYFVAEDGIGRAVAAGGWSDRGPQGGAGPRDVGHVRQVATHPAALRRGLASAILERLFLEARAAGMTWLLAEATRTSVPFCRTMGFEDRAEIEVTLHPGIAFPAVEMACCP